MICNDLYYTLVSQPVLWPANIHLLEDWHNREQTLISKQLYL